MERLSIISNIEVCLLPPGELFLPGKYKVCADVKMPEQKPIKKLEDNDRIPLGIQVAQKIATVCPRIGQVLLAVDEVKRQFINVGIFTDRLEDIHLLRDARDVHPKFACDLTNPTKPELLPEADWLKQ